MQSRAEKVVSFALCVYATCAGLFRQLGEVNIPELLATGDPATMSNTEERTYSSLERFDPVLCPHWIASTTILLILWAGAQECPTQAFAEIRNEVAHANTATDTDCSDPMVRIVQIPSPAPKSSAMLYSGGIKQVIILTAFINWAK